MIPPTKTHYDLVIIAALPAIREAEKRGAKCARQFTIFLNAANVAAPTGKDWTEWGYLKARRRLHAMSHTSPPLNYQAARDIKGHHDKRRVAMNAKMKEAGEVFRMAVESASSDDAITPLLKLKLQK